MVYRSTRAAKARGMDEATLKQILAEAIAELPDKDYITDLVENLEKKINENIQAEIEKAVKPLCNKIEILERKIAVYDAHFAGLERRLEETEIKIDDAEQYSRRACLRIYGIPPTSGNENAEQCEAKVKEVFKEIGVNVPDDMLDRAHRIGQKSKNKTTGVVEQTMIVKFVSWKYRTAVYRARKKSEDKAIQLDLTARRAKLLVFAKERVKDLEDVDFVYADVNCRIGMKTMNGEFFFFNSPDELEKVINENGLT